MSRNTGSKFPFPYSFKRAVVLNGVAPIMPGTSDFLIFTMDRRGCRRISHESVKVIRPKERADSSTILVDFGPDYPEKRPTHAIIALKDPSALLDWHMVYPHGDADDSREAERFVPNFLRKAEKKVAA